MTTRFPRPRSRRRGARSGLTFVEVLMAIAIASIFLVGIVGALSALLESASQAERRGEAARQARQALDALSEDLMQTSILLPPIASLSGTDQPLAAGDNIDNDGDGLVDEEACDGRNDDGGPVVQKHATLATVGPLMITERPRLRLVDDLGDEGVDEDTLFQNDILAFRTLTQRMEYRVDVYDGRPNVLVREVQSLIVPGAPAEIAPVAYDVVSFDLLFFNPNWILLGLPSPWATSWDSLAVLPGQIGLPPTVYAAVSVYSGDRPLAELPPGAPIPTVRLETQATLEAALAQYLTQFLTP